MAAAETLRIPAWVIAPVQGGVRPQWQQGSRVTYSSPPLAPVTGLSQRPDLGVGLAGRLRPAAANFQPVFHHHRADGRVGTGVTEDLPGRLHRPLHGTGGVSGRPFLYFNPHSLAT